MPISRREVNRLIPSQSRNVTDKARSLLTDAWQSTDEIRDGRDEPRRSKEQVRIALADLAKQKAALGTARSTPGPSVARPSAGKGLIGSGDVDATGSEFSSNERIHTLEPNSNAAFADVDPNSGR
jgi:hypothetical protein